MQTKSALMARLLVNRYVKGNVQPFLAPLPGEESKAISAIDTTLNDPLVLLKAPSERLSQLHYTWLKPIFEAFSEEVSQLQLSMLPKKLAEQLAKSLNLKVSSQKIAPSMKEYLNKIFLSKIDGIAEVTPLELLPAESLTFLTGLSHLEIVELCDFLGLYDIGGEMRQIVDQKILKNVYLALNPKEQSFLKLCLASKVKLVAPVLGLDRWNGDAVKLRHAIQARGLLRLGKALAGSHPDLLWHIAHKLDKGRGETLLRYYVKQPISGVTPLLIQQVQNVMNIMKKKSES
jgi:hypothetical protein